MHHSQKSPPVREAEGAGANALRLLAAAVLAMLLVCSCNGNAKKTNGQPPGQPPGTGAVHIQLNEVGQDIKVTGKVVYPILEKALQNAGIKTAPTSGEADLLIHGIVKLEHLRSERRIGLDYHCYSAQAAWQVIRVDGHRLILYRETLSEGAGTGKSKAITDTLTSLASKIVAEVVPFLQRETAGR